MSVADLKLQIIKLLDNQPIEVLQHWLNLLQTNANMSPNSLTEIEMGYKAMSEDVEREAEAYEWMENTLNPNEL